MISTSRPRPPSRDRGRVVYREEPVHTDAVQTPEGVFCRTCLPPHLAASPQVLFSLHGDEQLDAYPVCEACGAKHRVGSLTPLGDRFETEVSGPRPGDVLLTETGPALHLTELSICEEAVIGVFGAAQRPYLKDWLEGFLRRHAESRVWQVRHSGEVVLTDHRAAAEEALPMHCLVNRR
jgi:hypothetical protein